MNKKWRHKLRKNIPLVKILGSILKKKSLSKVVKTDLLPDILFVEKITQLNQSVF